MRTIMKLCNYTGQEIWEGVECVGPHGIGLWHEKIMENGATIQVYHELYVDLSLSLDAIRSGIRRSNKPHISLGHKLWNTSVLTEVDHEVFAEFSRLHCSVAGRVTRPQETWNLQEQAIHNKDAFLIVLRNKDGRMVGGGLFHISRTEGVYAVAVFDRTLFDFPLGHVVQIRAIEHMKKLGLRWYKIGSRPYPSDVNVPTKKELNIGHFKEGFATHVFLRLHTFCSIKNEDKQR
ncbi:MAG: GNAT family N-acetyltransferase [Candidatus Brocadiaceae bacterium]